MTVSGYSNPTSPTRLRLPAASQPMEEVPMSNSQITRRNMLATAAALVPFVPVAALALTDHVEQADPIFDAIERHKLAIAAFNDAVNSECELDESLPAERRRSYIHVDEREIFADDDPRWIAAVETYHDASEAMDDAALVVINVEPTTLAGVAALLAHAGHKGVNEIAPTGLVDDDDDQASFGDDWSVFVIRVAAVAVTRIAGMPS